mmetsp:Transcript_3120/g.11312  ORF Transcript_3120/g.11312 Transcript_3120/m.11312 type:complete len:346 (-) Transcript_3120:627-1664(-)
MHISTDAHSLVVQLGVQGGDGVLELSLELGPLELHRGRQQPPLDGEGLWGEVDGLHLLKAVELGAPALLLDGPQHGHDDPVVLAERGHVLWESPLLGPQQDVVRVRVHDRHEVAPQGVPVHEDLEHERGPLADLLDLLRGHVLALRELEEVLLPVNDLELPSRDPAPDVPGVEPPVLVQDLPGLRLVVVVALEHGGPPDADLPARVRLVRVEVRHVGDVVELDLHAGQGRADVADAGVVEPGHGDDADLGQAVALHHIREADPEEAHDVRGDGRGPADHELHLAPELGPELAEHDPVPELSKLSPGLVPLLQGLLLGSVRGAEHGPGQHAALLDPGVDLVVDPVP